MQHILIAKDQISDRTHPLAGCRTIRGSDKSQLLSASKDPAQLCAALDKACYECADVQKVEKDQSDTVSKAAVPGKFKDECNKLLLHYS